MFFVSIQFLNCNFDFLNGCVSKWQMILNSHKRKLFFYLPNHFPTIWACNILCYKRQQQCYLNPNVLSLNDSFFVVVVVVVAQVCFRIIHH